MLRFLVLLLACAALLANYVRRRHPPPFRIPQFSVILRAAFRNSQ
jgi:hypothetical protein